MCKRKKVKTKFYDDGSTISDMNVKGMPWYRTQKQTQERNSIRELRVTRKERMAMIRAAFTAYLPVFLIILFSFGLIFLLLILLYG
jgi:hypothetical protein